MSTEVYKALARQFYEQVWNTHDPDSVDDFLAADYRADRPPPGVTRDREGYKDWVHRTTAAFPNLRFVVNEQLGVGDTVVTRWTARGTHCGPFLGIPPTGRKVAVSGIAIARYDAQYQSSDFVLWDTYGLLQQLGVALPLEDEPTQR